jgi:hypothetical protein
MGGIDYYTGIEGFRGITIGWKDNVFFLGSCQNACIKKM